MLAETVDALVVLARGELNDAVAPYLWSDSLLFTYATEACDALAKDAEGLTQVLSLTITAGNPVVALPAHVQHVRAASLASTGRALLASNVGMRASGREDYGRFASYDLMDNTTGTPVAYIGDYEPGALRLTPIPSVNDALVLQCVVTIPFPLETGDDVPFTDSSDQRLLLHHMKMSAYSVHDKEIEDPAAAAKYKRLYDDGAKARKSQLHNNRRTPGTIRMEYY